MAEDGATYGIGRHFAEFVAKNGLHERAWRITDENGHGICIEGEDIVALIKVLWLSEDRTD